MPSSPDLSAPLVSILIPCYNAEQWIAGAIESALAQTYPHVEVVVVDDGSTDGSLEAIRAFDGRIRWETGPNRGGNVARNRLLELAEGTWVQYLDADDLLLPDKVAGQVAALRTDDVDVLYGPVLMQHEDEGPRRELLPISEPRDPWRLLARWELPQTGSPLWRRAAILDVGAWKVDQPVCQEHELYLRLLKGGKRFGYTPVAGAVYRQWSEGTVCRKDVPKTYRHRLAIMRAAEDHLLAHDAMTPVRRDAFNGAYLACARIIWTFDRAWAEEIMRHVESTNGLGFQPQAGQVPALYAWLYRRFGFAAAERVAALRRSLLPR